MWSHSGTIHCLSGRGRCWDLRGIMPKKGFLQKVYQNAKLKPAFLTFINKFRSPLDSPYFIAYQKSILHCMHSTKCKNISKSTVCSFSPSLSFFFFRGGGRDHLKYFRLQRGWESHPTKFLMKRESS